MAQTASAEAGYEAFTQQKLDSLLASGRPVFVNMTAAWCITCLVNERTALSTESVRAALSGKNVVYLKGDWTNRNPEITRLLERFGRSGVPLYVLYRRTPRLAPHIAAFLEFAAQAFAAFDPEELTLIHGKSAGPASASGKLRP